MKKEKEKVAQNEQLKNNYNIIIEPVCVNDSQSFLDLLKKMQ